MQITVAGEALIDVIISPSGAVSARPGGAPFNVARVVARLGADCQFLGRTGDDALGRRLRRALEECGVRVAVTEATLAPTTIAVAELDAAGVADYRFYLEGTSASQLRVEDVGRDALAASAAVVVGGLSLLMDPIATTLATLLPGASPAATVLLDPNFRRHAVAARSSLASVIAPFLDRADVVKISTDDLRLLAPGAEPRRAARALLDRGPIAVLITDGPGAVTVLTGETAREVPVPEVAVVDTVGAGDAFVAGFLAWWLRQGRGRGDLNDPDLVIDAARAAVGVAAAACTMAGAGLPDGFGWPEG